MNYTDLEAELHEDFWEEEGPSAELPFLETFLLNHPGHALEIGSGSGRLTFPLREKGFEIDGMDYSPDMLKIAREKSDAVSYETTFHEADMDEFELGRTFSAISIPSFSIQIASDPAQVLNNVRQHLEIGGGLYLSLFIPWAEIVGEIEDCEWYDDNAHTYDDGRSAFCKTRMEIDRIGQRLTREHHYRVYDRKDKLIREQQTVQHLKWFWKNEMSLMLEASGFTVDSVVQDFQADDSDGQVAHVLSFFATAR